MNGSLVFILHTHLPYVLHHGTWPHGAEWLTEAAAECYIPLLNVCHDLLEEGITPNLTFSLTPIVVEQLADSDFPAIFETYLDGRIEAAEKDIRYFEERPAEREYGEVARFWLDWFTARREDFVSRYDRDLVGAFRSLADRGAITLQTAGATHGYFPLLGFDASIDGQLSAAISSHRRHFGDSPRGIWMPECAYRPAYLWSAPVANRWTPTAPRQGVEQLLAGHGLEYTVVDSHLTRGGRPLGIHSHQFDTLRRQVEAGERFLPLNDERSIHEIYQICSTGDPEQGTVSIFTRDAATTLQVWSGVYGYPGDPRYLEFHKKHHNSGHRYWAVTDSTADLAAKVRYRPELIEARVKEQARHFVALVEQEMAAYRASTGREGTLAAPFDTELFGHWWFEGPRFIGEVLRLTHASGSVRARTAPDDLDARAPGMMIAIPEGSWGEGGDHRVWLNDETRWTWPMIYEVEGRFLSLNASRRSTDESECRILRQLAREMLLLEASDWQFLITTGGAVDYATKRFVEHHANAIFLADLVERLRRNERLADEEERRLGLLEETNRPFPDLRLEWW